MPTQKSEHPSRIKNFLTTISAIEWSDKDNIDAIFSESMHLIWTEISYYYRERVTHRWISTITRLVGFSAATIGFILPITSNDYGMAFMALATAAFGANTLFAGTSSHVRYVIAQVHLEKLVTLTTLEWQRLKNADAKPEEHIAYLQRQMEEAYKIILEESKSWGNDIQTALDAFERTLQNKPSQKNNDEPTNPTPPPPQQSTP